MSQVLSTMRLSQVLFCALLLAAGSVGLTGQNQADFNKPFPPHRVIGNVYYVGSEQLASFLVTTPAGHILVNSSFETTVPVIRAAVEKLGLRFDDIRIVLGSHAHGDHMEGDALIKELTGAQVMAMEQDVPALRNMRPGGKAHPIDRVLRDGEQVTLGSTTIVARLTAGHTKGCTTWTLRVQEAGKPYEVVILCSVGVNPGYVLVNNKDYPQIADDYVRSFKTLRSLPVDVFLGAHGSFYGLPEKYARLEKGAGPNPFIDPEGFRAHIDRQEKNFYARLEEQQKKAGIPQADEDLRRAAGRQWPTVSGDWGNTRYSTLNQINTQNIAKLGGAWVSETFTPAAAARTMPVVHNGLMFVTVPPSVYALDAKTGKTVWRFQAGAQAGMGAPAREGVAIGDGLVFVGLSDARVIALRENTGELVWNMYVGDKARDKGQVASGAPLYAGGFVSIGLSADNGWRGQVVGLDARTGKEAWRFFAVPAPGEPGSETWPKNSPIWQRGGGAVWLVGAADPDLGLVYYVTGNGVPQLAGEGRPGDNLYLCSIVALDMKTGRVRWHYQVIRHDIWEGDISISPVLYDADINGRTTRAIAAMRADGYLFMLDRETGKPLAKIEDRRVPRDSLQKAAATQPYPAGADSALPDCDYWKSQRLPRGFELSCAHFTPASVDKPNQLTPTFGMRVAPMSYSPDTRYFYVTGNASLGWLRRDDNPWFFSNAFNQRVPGLNTLGHGVLAAIDSRTNKIVWKKEFRPGRPGGAMTTAGGLMFQMAPDGNLQAYDAKTGAVQWQFQTGAAGGPPLSYEIDGEQYVAAITTRGVWAFKIGGSVPPAAAPSSTPPQLFTGDIVNTTQIETAALIRDTGFTGFHYMTDEYAFSPYRARVKRGAQVTWRNNGLKVHTIIAEDGSWSTGPLNTADVGGVTFDKAGTYTYFCKEHPWAVGQVIVE